MHKSRNCRFFPEDWSDSRFRVWMAYYRNPKGEQVAVEHTSTSECPRSMVTPDIEWLNGQFHSNLTAVKAGGTLYGPKAGHWPAWFCDVLEALTQEQRTANSMIGIPDGR